MHSTFTLTVVVAQVAASFAAVVAVAASATGPATGASATVVRGTALPEAAQGVSQPKQRRAAVARVNGTCGEDHRSRRAYIPLKLCHDGIPGDFSGEGPWQWRCAGNAGGKSVWCSATYDGT